jgi:hypothetical protein
MKCSRFALPARGLALLALAGLSTWAQAVTSYQSALSRVSVGGVWHVDAFQEAQDGYASTQGIWPASTQGAQARTAARSRASEFAVNSLVDDPRFSGTSFDFVASGATYHLVESALLVPQHVAFDFLLPPSYLEITSNAEAFRNPFTASLSAQLMACSRSACQGFEFSAELVATYQGSALTLAAIATPGLDIDALRAPTTTDSGTGHFQRTVLVEWPEFVGHIDMGVLYPGDFVRIDYSLGTVVSGVARHERAAAAINDPFYLNTDPVGVSPPVTLHLAPVPEPTPLAMLSTGLLGLWLLRRRRR